MISKFNGRGLPANTYSSTSAMRRIGCPDICLSMMFLGLIVQFQRWA
jgi:hypothetical protein